MNTGIYKPFNKPNNKPSYIYASSNHPPFVLKQIPKSVSKRITANSCNEDILHKGAPFYNSILQDCGFNENIKYCPEESVSSRRRKNRSRNIIWYNPPFSRNVKTNVGKHFFKLLKKHFGKNHKYHKIFNKNNIKVSYSCMDNFILIFAKQSLRLDLTVTKSLFVIGRTKKIQNYPSTPRS